MKVIKIKINFNTWLEFKPETTAEEIQKRIENFIIKAGKHYSVGYAASNKDNF